MTESKARLLANIIDNTGDIKSTSLDNVSTGLTVYSTLDDLPTSGLTSGQQAFVTSANRVYVSNGSGWYSVALFNATPRLSISPSGDVTLAVDGSTPTVITLTGTDSDNADANLVYSVESDGSFANIATLSQDSSVFTITPLAEDSATPGSSTLTFKVSDGVSFGSGTTTFSLTFAPDWSTKTEYQITGSASTTQSRFGQVVDISSDGNYIIVGSAIHNGGTGIAYIFTKSGSSYIEQSVIYSSDLAASDYYGYKVAINSDGTYAAVSALYEDQGGADAGAVYVFTRSGSTWSQQAKLLSTDLAADDGFGYGLAINSDGTYILVGAPNEDPSSVISGGSAYVFTRSGTSWSQQAKLVRSPNTTTSSQFGTSCALSDDGSYAIVGAPNNNSGDGNSFIYTRSGSSWSQQQMIVHSDPTGLNYIGAAVSMNSDGTYVLIGGRTYSSGAYVFTRSGSTWSQQAKLVSTDKASSDKFGNCLKLNSDASLAVIGAGAYTANQGKAYVFSRDGTSWTQDLDFTASNVGSTSYFAGGEDQGVSINGTGDKIVVGAPWHDEDATDAGKVYIYEAG